MKGILPSYSQVKTPQSAPQSPYSNPPLLCSSQHYTSYTQAYPEYSPTPTSSHQPCATATQPNDTLRKRIYADATSIPNLHKFLDI